MSASPARVLEQSRTGGILVGYWGDTGGILGALGQLPKATEALGAVLPWVPRLCHITPSCRMHRGKAAEGNDAGPVRFKVCCKSCCCREGQ